MSGKIEGQFNKNRLREAAEYHGMYREKIESDILNFFKYNDLISRDVFLNSLPQHPLGSILACLEDLIKKTNSC
jgi:hypothetical protein